jgi:putative spermidine/putrescine transport system substrate-binding protein
MYARTLLAAVALFAVSGTAATALDLTVVARGEALLPALQEVFLQPFTAATDIPVQKDSWEGGLETLRTSMKAPDNAWDMVLVDPGELAVGCAEGLFEKLDWPAVGGKEHYMPQAVTNDCGLGAFLANVVLAWDRDKFPGTPTWADFWDVAKYPGKRGLRQGVRGNLEIALIADNVSPGDVYKTLATSDGVDRAFRKLDQLRPYIVWWQNDGEAARILGSGDVLMTSAPSGRIVTANRLEKRNFGIQWGATLYEVHSWAVLKGSANQRLAQQLLYFMGTPAIEAKMLRLSGETGLAKGVNDGLAPDILASSPGNPANLGSALRMDTGFWNENLSKLRPRFESGPGR